MTYSVTPKVFRLLGGYLDLSTEGLWLARIPGQAGSASGLTEQDAVDGCLASAFDRASADSYSEATFASDGGELRLVQGLYVAVNHGKTVWGSGRTPEDAIRVVIHGGEVIE